MKKTCAFVKGYLFFIRQRHCFEEWLNLLSFAQFWLGFHWLEPHLESQSSQLDILLLIGSTFEEWDLIVLIVGIASQIN
jgi:hypothetical protein